MKYKKKFKTNPNSRTEKMIDHHFSITENTVRHHNGQDLEALVSNMLGIMTIKGEIDSFRKACAKEDSHGVDFFVKYHYQSVLVVLPLQVKTSFCGLVMHEEKYGDTIPCIYFNSHETLEVQLKRVMKKYAERVK